MREPTLFGHALQDEIRAAAKTFETKERTVIDKFITLDNKKFDAEDLQETLSAVLEGDIAVDYSLGETLVKLKVLTTRGNRNSHGAQSGENFVLLKDILDELLKEKA